MAQDTVVAGEEITYPNDQVPEPYKRLFSNDEWILHDIVVKATYGFLVIAIVAHTLTWLWEPWLIPTAG